VPDPYVDDRCASIAISQRYLALNDIEHTTTANNPQTNGICERFYKTIPLEFSG
jgi:transposase InsO family protein